MYFKKVHWGLAAGGFVVAEALLVAVAFAWVAVYSYLVNPGHEAGFYERYAQTTSPYVGLLLGMPVFFFTCRWIGWRAPSAARATALAFFGLFCLIELGSMLALDNPATTPWLEAVNIPAKLVSCLWGASSAQRAG